MIDPRDRLNPNALIIERGQVTQAPGGNIPPPLEPMAPVPDAWMQRLREQDAAEKAKRQQQYDMEVESAERLRRAQEADQYWSRGIRPPDFLSEFRPPSAALVNSQKPQFLKSGQDWYRMNGEAPELVIDAPERNLTPSRVIPAGQEGNIPIPEGYGLVPYGTAGFTIERKPAENIATMFNRISGGGQQQPQSRQAVGGYQVGKTYRGLKYLGGDPLDERNWQK